MSDAVRETAEEMVRNLGEAGALRQTIRMAEAQGYLGAEIEVMRRLVMALDERDIARARVTELESLMGPVIEESLEDLMWSLLGRIGEEQLRADGAESRVRDLEDRIGVALALANSVPEYHEIRAILAEPPRGDSDV